MGLLRVDPAADCVEVVAPEQHRMAVGEDTGLVTAGDNLEPVRRHLAEGGMLDVDIGRPEELRILAVEEVVVHILAAEGVGFRTLAVEDMASARVEDTGLQEAADNLAEAGSLEMGSLGVDSLEMGTG